jgi:NAD-dependent SIR2 family protein deacetylase
LAQLLVSGKVTVFITGAGLSVGSGIRPFRDSSALLSSSSTRHRSHKAPPPQQQQHRSTSLTPPAASNAIWNSVIWTTATREAFRKNPLQWYNQFWIPHFHPNHHDNNNHHHHHHSSNINNNSQPSTLQQQTQQRQPTITTTATITNNNIPQPNAGHYALHQLEQLPCTKVFLITQNVDGLHLQVEQEEHDRMMMAKEKVNDDEEEEEPMVMTMTMVQPQHPRLDDDAVNANTVQPSDTTSVVLPIRTPPTPTSLSTTTSSSTTTLPTTTTLDASSSTLMMVSSPKVSKAPGRSSSSVSSKVIEAHGRLGLYKCLPDSDSDTDNDSDEEADRPVHLGHRRKSRALRQAYLAQQQQQQQQQQHVPTHSPPTMPSNGNDDDDDDDDEGQPKHRNELCKYQYMESLTVDQLEPAQVRSVLSPSSTAASSSSLPAVSLVLSTPPTCPSCGRFCLPQALLFDEGYHSHVFYQFEQIEQILAQAQVIVFVGTSFSVTLTQVALCHAKKAKLPVYNINPLDLLHPTSHVHNICGQAEVILPRLLELCRQAEQTKSTI